MTETLDLSIYVRHAGGNAHMDLAVEGVGCAGCIRKIENGLKAVPGIVDARLNFTNRRLAVRVARRRARRRRRDPRARAHRLSAPIRSSRSAREAEEAARRDAAHEMPRGRGLRGHEHHAAVGVGLVRQRLRHDAGDARLLPLALGADRAAGSRLCRPAVLPQRLARDPGARAQHGRADLARRAARARACRSSRPRTTRSTPISIRP